MRFACVWVGDKYSIDFVHRLRRGVARYYPHPHEFVCFTDKPEMVAGSPAVDISHTKLGGWWAKLALLNPEIRGNEDWTVYLDLDTVIVGSLEPLAAVRDGFSICENFTRLAGHKDWCRYGSCVMVFPPRWGMDHWMSVSFWKNLELTRYGDQGVIERLVPNATLLQGVLPKGYMLGYRDFDMYPNAKPAGVSLLIYAGKRNPANYGPTWAYSEWVA